MRLKTELSQEYSEAKWFMEDQKKRDYFTNFQIGIWLLLVATLIWLIFFLLSIPSISEYCEEGKSAYFAINIWKDENCARYWEAKYDAPKLEQENNISIQFLNIQHDLTKNLTGQISSCGIYKFDEILININRTRCGLMNNTIEHELKHHKCYIQGYRWRNNTEAHEGCFLNVTL